jgi:hypothetical protein
VSTNVLHGNLSVLDEEAYIENSSTFFDSIISSLTSEDTVFLMVLLHVQ